MNLSIAKTELFNSAQCDFWMNGNDEVFMSVNQLAQALGYKDRNGIEQMVHRNDYLKEIEFSVTDKLSGTDGKLYETRIFTEDGIYEVTMLSKTEKAKEFRQWVRKILKGLRKGETVLVQPQSEDAKLLIQKQRAEAMLLNAKTRQAKLILDMQKNKTLSAVAVELLGINAIETLIDKPIEYRPQIEKTYTAGEIGKEIGVSANKIGRLAKAHDLKTTEYGIEVLDKSRHSDKQVPSFRYNEKGKAKLIEIVKGVI